MRDLCKEQDYEFLGMSEKTTGEEATEASVDEWRDRKEEVVRDEDGLRNNTPTLQPTARWVCFRSAGAWRGSSRNKRGFAR